MHGWKNPNDPFKKFEVVARASIAKVPYEVRIEAKACWRCAARAALAYPTQRWVSCNWIAAAGAISPDVTRTATCTRAQRVRRIAAASRG
ncbi:hypothetical protein C2L66_35395 [Paraburkholderia caribensis]|nr:hypothetical protein C2L66_35395 [Paraburkholderia caribensis]CAG9196536.1 hypothetical protein BCAR13_1190009 [Paraburkholderia caribensis]